jgi:predicted DNA-binding helix-hairpin-helix protein
MAISFHKKPTAEEKLAILSQASQYDLACACGTQDPQDHRRRSKDNHWIYPVALPDGRYTFLLKTLVSNVCRNNCKYCPLRANQDPRRCSLKPEELVNLFLEYYRQGKVSGLFLSSGNIGSPDQSMEQLNQTVAILRKRKNFRGYIHLKIIPGASLAAIEEALSLSSAVSLNIETAGEKNFNTLCSSKDYLRDIIQPMQLISQLTQKGSRFSKVKQTTQFMVGAANEKDREIIQYCWGLYKKLGQHRIYFSAYQRGLGDKDLPGEQNRTSNEDLLLREHRLYQVDWLFRKYGFSQDEIPFDREGNLPLSQDPKEIWALQHPDFFPVDINRADYLMLLRVPGLGPTTARHILELRRGGQKIWRIEDLGKPSCRSRKIAGYLKFFS